jgi:hypothetical protein
MNKKSHIYIILYFILIILVIDIFISYSVSNNIYESFQLLENISGENIIALINILINELEKEKKINKNYLLFVINTIIIKYEENINSYFSNITDQSNLINEFNNKLEIFNQFKSNIDKLHNDIINDDTEISDDIDPSNADEILNNVNIILDIDTNSNQFLEEQSLIFNNFKEISLTTKKCKHINSINKFLVLFYIKYIANDTNSVSKIRFLTTINELINVCQNQN